jgi:glycosyltransferase involved in cell wall biosynthesis
MSGPELSVIVVVYNMPRAAPRTLQSLATDYQRYIRADEYEVIVVDNGSNPPLDPAILDRLPGNFRLLRMDPAPASPCPAINRGLEAARGQIVGVLEDGARLATPGLLHFARCGVRLYPRAFVATMGWYLGSDFQSYSMLAGYNAAQEDALLDSIGWPADGYRLFEVSTPDESAANGWFSGVHASSAVTLESTGLFLRREIWQELGGYDERFDLPGGGMCDFDIYYRTLAIPDMHLIVMAGEGTFHQLHGGVSTNTAPDALNERIKWLTQYLAIRGRIAPPVLQHPPTYLGTWPRSALVPFVYQSIDPVRSTPMTPVGPCFDLWAWPDTVAAPADPTTAALVQLMQAEFRAGRYDAVAAVARIARVRAPQEPEPLRILRRFAPYCDERAMRRPKRSAQFHLAVGRAYDLTGQRDKAAEAFNAAREVERASEPARPAVAALNRS